MELFDGKDSFEIQLNRVWKTHDRSSLEGQTVKRRSRPVHGPNQINTNFELPKTL